MNLSTRIWKAKVLGFLLLGGLAAFPPPGGLRAADNVSVVSQLKDSPGKALVVANCIPCHSTAIIAANHLTRRQWDETITTMQKKNGMWPVIPVVRRQILDYLAVAQRPDDRGLTQGKVTQWASPLYRPNPLWK